MNISNIAYMVNKKNRDFAPVISDAVSTANISFIKQLVAEGYDVNIPDSSGYTALMNIGRQMHSSAKQKQLITDFLLDNGANPNIKNKVGYNAYYYNSHIKIHEEEVEKEKDSEYEDAKYYDPDESWDHLPDEETYEMVPKNVNPFEFSRSKSKSKSKRSKKTKKSRKHVLKRSFGSKKNKKNSRRRF